MYKIEFDDALAKLHYKRVKYRIISLAKHFINDGTYIMAEVPYKANDSTKVYLRQLEDEQYLEKLITGRPTQLRDIIQSMDPNAMRVPPIKSKKTILNNQFNLNRILYYIFVKSIYEKNNYIDKNEFIKNIGIKTCPYCNRSYIHSVIKQGSTKTVKPQIDHFFPKSKYPFLGASYYNLIPSCLLCNGFDCKAEQSPVREDSNPTGTQKILNPYEFKDDSLKFSFEYRNSLLLVDIYSIKPEDIDLIFSGDNQLWSGYEDIFALKSLYEKHKDYILEIIYKLMYMYNPASLNYLSNITNGSIVEADIIQTFWGFPLDRKEAKNRILTKFLNDILDKAHEYQEKKNYVER